MTYDRDPPSDSLLMSLRKHMQFDAAQYVKNGGAKVARVRIEVEFSCGESIVQEITCPQPHYTSVIP